jgi:hypothetical protein
MSERKAGQDAWWNKWFGSKKIDQLLSNQPQPDLDTKPTIEEKDAPVLGSVETAIGTIYYGEVFGKSNKKTRSSFDRSIGLSFDNNQGMAGMVCDGVGQDPFAAKLAARVINRFVDVVHKITPNSTLADRKKGLDSIAMLAVEDCIELDGRETSEPLLTSTTMTGYTIWNEWLVGAHVGDSELHLINNDNARCLSSREHHFGHQLFKAVSTDDSYFEGHLILERVAEGNLVLAWSDGFAKYWLEPLMLDQYHYGDDSHLFKSEVEARKGAAYQYAMAKLKEKIIATINAGGNPVEVLLAEAQEEANKTLGQMWNPTGYHDDISFIMSVVKQPPVKE